MTLPSIDDLESVGGKISDYRPVPDPTVEREATSDNIIAADAAMATRTVDRVWVKFLGHATTPTVSAWDAVWKGATPTAPTLNRVSAGVIEITVPATVEDELGEEHSVNLRAARVEIEGTTFGFHTATVATNVITVRLANTAGAANDFAGIAINVFAI